MNKIKVCLISDSHKKFDDRIYWKEALSLQYAGYIVYHLCVGDEELIFETPEKIHIFQIKREIICKNRYINFLLRLITGKSTNNLIFKAAKKINADFYHLHDLKLLHIAKKIKKLPWHPKLIHCIRESYADMVTHYDNYKGFELIARKLYSKYIESWKINK